MTHARRLPLVLGTVVAAVVLALLSLGGGPRSAGSAVTVPDRLADYSYLTGDVSDAASGPGGGAVPARVRRRVPRLPPGRRPGRRRRRLPPPRRRRGPGRAGDPGRPGPDAALPRRPPGGAGPARHDRAGHRAGRPRDRRGLLAAPPGGDPQRAPGRVVARRHPPRLPGRRPPDEPLPRRSPGRLAARARPRHRARSRRSQREAGPPPPPSPPTGRASPCRSAPPATRAWSSSTSARAPSVRCPTWATSRGAHAWSPDGRLLAVEQPSGIVAVEVAAPYGRARPWCVRRARRPALCSAGPGTVRWCSWTTPRSGPGSAPCRWTTARAET